MGISFFWFLGALIQLARAAVRPGRTARRRGGVDAAVHRAGDRHRRRQPRRPAGSRATRSSWASCRSAAFGMGVFSLLLVFAVPSYWLCAAGARAGRVLRRLVRGAAERAAAARAGRRREGPRPGDQQRRQHRRHPARVGRALRARRAAGHERRARSSAIAGVVHAARDHLHPDDPAGLLRALRAVDADAHGLPHQDRRPAEHPAARARRSSSRTTCR